MATPTTTPRTASRRWFHKALAMATLSASIVVGVAQTESASAATCTTRRCAADAVVAERVGGPLYGYYKARFPEPQLVWSHDGCSVPWWLSSVTTYAYSKVFVHSCDRHDFGYRNYGKGWKGGPKFDPTRSRKDSIDSRFLANMKVNCDGLSVFNPLKIACKTVAQAFYTAVHVGGDKAFFG